MYSTMFWILQLLGHEERENNALGIKITMNVIYRFSSHRAVNTLSLSYKNQSVDFWILNF